MIINGIWWLVIVVAVFLLFFVMAKMKKPFEATHKVSNSLKSSTQNVLQNLHKQLVNRLPEYTVNMKKNHITIKKASKKLMMITLDKGVAVGTRKLGGVVVMNFHKTPSYKQVLSELQS